VKHSGNPLFKGPLTKVISVALGLCLVLLAAVWVRVFCESMHAHRKGEAYFKKHQYVKAITFFDRSIHWYTPFNPYVHKSAQRLWEICIRAEQHGDIRRALVAARTIKRGFLAARSFYTPGQDWIDRCHAKIASLMARDSEDQQLDSAIPVSFPPQKGSEPDLFWTLILEVGFFGWIGSVIGLLMLGMTDGETLMFRPRPAILWGMMVVIFYIMWILGMMRS